MVEVYYFSSTFTHSLTQFFNVFGRNVSLDGVLFCHKQLNNCFWKILVALRMVGWCDLCRVICSFGMICWLDWLEGLDEWKMVLVMVLVEVERVKIFLVC